MSDILSLVPCEWGYCLKVEEYACFHSQSLTGLGWGSLLIPILVGMIIGGLIVYIYMQSRAKKRR